MYVTLHCFAVISAALIIICPASRAFFHIVCIHVFVRAAFFAQKTLQ